MLNNITFLWFLQFYWQFQYILWPSKWEGPLCISTTNILRKTVQLLLKYHDFFRFLYGGRPHLGFKKWRYFIIAVGVRRTDTHQRANFRVKLVNVAVDVRVGVGPVEFPLNTGQRDPTNLMSARRVGPRVGALIISISIKERRATADSRGFREGTVPCRTQRP